MSEQIPLFDDLPAFVAWAIKAGWQAGLQIDRRDNDGPYSPGNCRFVTRKRNKRNCRNTLRDPDGIALADHAERLGMTRAALRDRVARGMPWRDVLALPKSVPAVRYFLSDATPLRQAIRLSGLPERMVYARIARGWSPDDAVSIPKGGMRPAATVAVALDKGRSPARRVVQGDEAQRPAAVSIRKRKAKGNGDA